MHNSHAALQGSQPPHALCHESSVVRRSKMPVICPTQQRLIWLEAGGLFQRQSIQKSHIFRDIQQLLKLQILQYLQYKSKIYRNHYVKQLTSVKFT